MLDFYIIDDNQALPAYPEKNELEFAGGIDYQTFSNLQRKRVIDERLDYYSDFRIDTSLTKQIRQIITRLGLHADSDVKILLQLFDAADKKRCGLVAYTD